MIDLDLRCNKCDRFLGLKGVKSIIAQVRCPNSKCKALNNIKVVNSNSTEADLRYKFPDIIEEKYANKI